MFADSGEAADVRVAYLGDEMVKLGTKVTDSITGFTGIATSRTEYMFGCVRVAVEPAMVDGKLPEAVHFDEQRLEDKPTAISGGPGDIPPARQIPRR
jgi:hypothetical protein